MKRLLFASLLVLPLALSRTGARADQDDAYGSLIGMAGSAASDRGPEAGGIPPDNPSIEERAPSSVPASSAAYAPARAERPAKPAAGPSVRRAEAKEEEEAPSVAVLPAPAPRVWTMVFSSLLPPRTRAAAFEVAVSTGPRRVLPEPARRATAASVAGSAQGMRELVAAATAPTLNP